MTINMKKTNKGIKHFTDKRDWYITKSRQEHMTKRLVDYFKRKANEMQENIDHTILNKTTALATFN